LCVDEREGDTAQHSERHAPFAEGAERQPPNLNSPGVAAPRVPHRRVVVSAIRREDDHFVAARRQLGADIAHDPRDSGWVGRVDLGDE